MPNSIFFFLMLSHNLIWQFAGIYLKPDANKKYYGVGATIAIYQPVTISGQISAALIRLESGGPGYGGYVETGWMVYRVYFSILTSSSLSFLELVLFYFLYIPGKPRFIRRQPRKTLHQVECNFIFFVSPHDNY